MLSSCSKESLVSNDKNGKEAQVFTATMEDGITTKVTFDATNKCALWEVNDEISIDGHTYKATSAGASSTFTGEGATETTHHAYFPANLYNGGTPILPAELAYAEGKFNMPMYAESSSLDLSFKNLCGVLAITVNGSDFTSVEKIEVSSDKQMNGEFTATAAGVLTFASKTLTAADKKVTLTFASAKAIASDGSATFYIPVPANTHRPLTIKISDGTNSETMVTNKAGGVEVERNTVYPITFAKIETIADVLATVEGGFPTSTGKKWTNGCGMTAYIYGTNFVLQSFTIALSTPVNKSGNCYTASVNTTSTTGTLTFNMKDGILTNFEYKATEGKTSWDGKYVASIALPGVFSVSDTKKVHFSRGNLWFGKVGDITGLKRNFEAEQYSISSSWDANHVSNFYWSKTASVAYAESYEESGTSASDVLFTNATETTAKTDFEVNGQKNVWRTLSHDEWKYLFENHTYKYVSVNGKSGIVIAPDGFSGTIADSYDATAWATAESNGFVFLPNTGYRDNNKDFWETGISCIYWTSTASGYTEDEGQPTAYRMFFQWKNSSLDYRPNEPGERQWAVGIRLVTE